MAVLPPSSIPSLFQPVQSGGAGGASRILSTLSGGAAGGGGGISGSLLQQAANAQLAVQNARFQDSAQFRQPSGPDVSETPFDQPEDERAVTAKARDVLRKDNLIDFDNRIVSNAENEPDAQKTFVLYNALRDLQTLAEAASDKDATDAFRQELDARFQSGLEEVRGFINNARSDLLFLQSGERGFSAESSVEFERASSFVDGQVIQPATRGAAIPGLNGDEVFDLDITGSDGFNTSVTVDLSTISGDITLEKLKTALNDAITSEPSRDGNGDVVTDSDGNPIPRFISRFDIFEDDNGDFGLQFKGSSFEDVRFVPPATASPALRVAGGTSPLVGDDNPATGLVSELSDITGDIAEVDETTIASIDRFATQVQREQAEAEAEEFDPLNLTDDDFVLPSLRDAAEQVSESETQVRDIAVDSDGFTYVVGSARGDLGQNVNVAEEDDLFLSKLDSAGNVLFSRSLGVSKDADGFRLALDSQDNVIVTGRTTEESGTSGAVRTINGVRLSTQDSTSDDVFSGTDTVVAKFNGEGQELFRRQFDSPGEDGGLTVTVGANDEILVGGYATGSLSGPAQGGEDGRVLRLNKDTGEIEDEVQLGTTGDDRVVDVARASDDNILVLSEENGRAILSKRDAADLTNELARQDLGLLSGGKAGRLAVDPNDGSVFVTGATDNGGFGAGATVNNAASGGQDGFVLKVSDGGGSLTPDFISFVGSTGTDSVEDLVIDNGKLFVTGTASGSVAGAEREGSQDAFVARLDAVSGAVEDVEQLGETLTRRTGNAIAFAPNGRSVIDKLGFAQGDLIQEQPRDVISRSAVRAGDSFFIKAGDRAAERITIDHGDTIGDLVRKVNAATVGAARAQEAIGSDALRIEAAEGESVQLLAGPDGRDALSRLGLEAETLYGKDLTLGLSDDSDDEDDGEDLGGAFAFNLNQDFTLKDAQSAQFTFNQLDDSVATTQRAFRSLTFNPLRQLLSDNLNNRGGGEVSQATQQRLANLQSGLQRLQATQQQASFASPVSLLA